MASSDRTLCNYFTHLPSSQCWTICSSWFLVLGILSVLCVLGNFDILALSVFDDGNMPAIQLIPRGGLKSPHYYEGWIVAWSR